MVIESQPLAAGARERSPTRTAPAAEDDIIKVGNLRIRPSEGLALADGRPLRLSVREFGLLVELARQQGRVVSRENLYRAVWGSGLRAGDRTIDVYVRRLRVKLAAHRPDWVFIHTHVGFGYRLQPESAG